MVVKKKNKLPLLEEVLEIYAKTPEGLTLWKPKGVELTFENSLENILVLSSDLAVYFDMKHNDLCERNVSKLQREGYLPERLRNVAQSFLSGYSTKRDRIVYALTRHETEYLIMDLVGPKARAKKFAILKRLHAIESAVLRGAYQEARAKAATWEGVQLLQQMGFHCSVDNRLATKKDISQFLHIPPATLDSFLRRHEGDFSPVALDRETIKSLGSRATKLHAYNWEDATAIVFWINTPMSMQLREKLLGKVGRHFKPEVDKETQWETIFLDVFAGFGLERHCDIGNYQVDFLVKNLRLVLECDSENHSSYNKEKESERERFLSQYYTVIRFNSKIELQKLVNAILQAKPKEVFCYT